MFGRVLIVVRHLDAAAEDSMREARKAAGQDKGTNEPRLRLANVIISNMSRLSFGDQARLTIVAEGIE